MVRVNKSKGVGKMTGNDLLKFTKKYLKDFPDMAHQDVIVTTTVKRKLKGGDFYRKYKITSIGMNAIIGKDRLNLGIESVS